MIFKKTSIFFSGLLLVFLLHENSAHNEQQADNAERIDVFV